MPSKQIILILTQKKNGSIRLEISKIKEINLARMCIAIKNKTQQSKTTTQTIKPQNK